MWRDVLPTTAHRWIMRQPGRVRALDCAASDQESESIPWLTGDRVTLLGDAADDCIEPNLSQKLAALGYTHLIASHHTAEGKWLMDHPAPDGLRVAARFDDGEVFAVATGTPAVYTAAMTGFFPREHAPEWTWRWMSRQATWTVVNTTTQPIVATLSLELSAFHDARRLGVRLDGRPVQTLAVLPARAIHQIGPVTVLPGRHTLAFQSADAPAAADAIVHNGDVRLLSFDIGGWSWNVSGAWP
jgi:hypothetical protein